MILPEKYAFVYMIMYSNFFEIKKTNKRRNGQHICTSLYIFNIK